MSEEESEAAHPIEASQIRPSMGGHRVLEMDVLGWIIFLALLLVLLPVLPFLVVVVVLMRLLGLGERRTVSWG